MTQNIFSNPVSIATRSFAAYNKQATIREKSSSGGLFYTFAQKVIDDGGVVFGAAFDKDWQVFHRECTTLQEVESLLQSKYVQSDMNTCYKRVKECINENKIVLFCGTPCQVYGLLSYLEAVNKKQDYRKKLITIDFICHGVPSRMVWRKYLQEIARGREITSVNFRDKTNGWRDFSLKIEYSDGSTYLESWLKDPYVKGFIKNLYLRQSCYECRFRGIDRESDFTIADFWSVHKLMPDFYDDRGTSILLVHNERAVQFLEIVKNEFFMCEIANEMVATTNKSLVKSMPKNTKRLKFFKDLQQPHVNLSKVIMCATKVSLLSRIKIKILRILTSK